jgi:isopenicillin N synthase-like dioxygenase
MMELVRDFPIRALDVDELSKSGDAPTAVIDELMRSLRTGFVFVRHDLATGLLDEAYDTLGRFFALDPMTKSRQTPADPLANSGYRGLSSERAVGAAVADWKETFQWCSELAAGHPLRDQFPARYARSTFPEAAVRGITGVLRALQQELFACQRAVVRAIAVGLGASAEIGDDLLVDADVVTRAIHYPPLPSDSSDPADGAPGELTWADAHVDINLITILPPASGPGLQVATEQGWVAADPPDGHLVLNTGIMLDRLSNGVIPAGLHRVRPPGDGLERLAIAQFCHPSPWTVLSPLQVTVTPDRPQRYGAIRACDLLARTIWEISETGP